MPTPLAKYILDGHNVVEELDLRKWAMWYENAANSGRLRVAYDKVYAGPQLVVVSTVFLGLDMNFAGIGSPKVFESMTMGGEHDGLIMRSSTWEDAEILHKVMVNRANGYGGTIS